MPERLTPLELDFLWEAAGAGELPYPLRPRSHGETMEERAVLRRKVLAELAQRGLADGEGKPEPFVEDWFGVLAVPEVSLDSVQVSAPEAEPRLSTAAAVGTLGVLAVQDQQGISVEKITSDGLAGAIVGLLPSAPRGKEKSITVPLEQLLSGPGVDFLQRRAPSPGGSSAASPWDGGGERGEGKAGADEDRKALARLHAQPRLRGGQLGANARGRSGGRVRMPVLSWFDTETGRYFTQATQGGDGRDWITIAPADAATLRHRLSEMLAGALGSTAASL
ncbi:ESX secretion-associated protein EspG [Saccharomonospora sp. NPDC006951]